MYVLMYKGTGTVTELMLLSLNLLDGDYASLKEANGTDSGRRGVRVEDHCSGLVRLTADMQDLFISQVEGCVVYLYCS
jgi:hypothetical protein